LEALGEALLDKKRVSPVIDRYDKLIAVIPTDAVKNWLTATGLSGARVLARHLPRPSVTKEGQPVVHPTTLVVLEMYGSDDRTLREFAAGTGSFFGWGDIAALHRARAEEAARFLGHPVEALRKWATQEVAWSERSAAQEQQRQDEED
jgi:hypothetical protein